MLKGSAKEAVSKIDIHKVINCNLKLRSSTNPEYTAHLKTEIKPIHLTDISENSYLFNMALRVLLADESPTIKKVFQLSLQDFAVEVKSVNVGIDVVAVAEQFQPDIIFADVLLQKQNGYDVSRDIKNHPQLKTTPVVLMWSGFMELDEAKYTESQANGKIEKPFDVDILRKIVTDLVPKTQSQTLSQYLTYPELPKEASTPNKKPEGQPLPPPVSTKPADPESPPMSDQKNWSMDSFDNIDNYTGDTGVAPSPFEEEGPNDFKEFSLSENLKDEDEEESDSPWVQSNIRHINTAKRDLSDDTPPVAYKIPEEGSPHLGRQQNDLEFEIEPRHDDHEEREPSFNFIQTEMGDLQVEDVAPSNVSIEQDIVVPPIPGFERKGREVLTEEKVRQIVAEECENTIKDMLQDLIPQLARKVIEAEIQKLLKEL